MLSTFSCTYWPLNISSSVMPFAHFLIGLFVFWMGYEFPQSFLNLPFLPLSSIPLDLSLSPTVSQSQFLTLSPTFRVVHYLPLSLLLLLHLYSSFSSQTPQNLRICPRFPFHIRRNSITSPVISVLAGFHVPNRGKDPLSSRRPREVKSLV